MIKFEQGSGQFASGAELFMFEASLDGRPLRCAMSREAFEDLTRETVDPDNPEAVFAVWEFVVFETAARKYERDGLNEKGVLALNTIDVERLRQS